MDTLPVRPYQPHMQSERTRGPVSPPMLLSGISCRDMVSRPVKSHCTQLLPACQSNPLRSAPSVSLAFDAIVAIGEWVEWLECLAKPARSCVSRLTRRGTRGHDAGDSTGYDMPPIVSSARKCQMSWQPLETILVGIVDLLARPSIMVNGEQFILRLLSSRLRADKVLLSSFAILHEVITSYFALPKDHTYIGNNQSVPFC